MVEAETTKSPAPVARRTVRWGLPLLALLALVGAAPSQPAPAAAPTVVQVPADLGLDSLPGRAAAQRAAAAGWDVAHDFRFTDRRAESGITFRQHIVDDAGVAYKAVHYDHGNGVVAADVDGDGKLDLYFVSQLGGDELWRNLGGGRFENVTAKAGVALADRVGVTASFADVDNDGDADLFVTSVRGGNTLFLNDGHGHFRDATQEAGLAYSGHSSAAVFFDYDNDGLLDLFLANVGVYTTDERGRGGYYVGIKDAFNGHLYPERAERSILYHNLGGDRFEDVSEKVLLVDRSWSGDATPIDFDGDGFQDLYVLDMQGQDHYYQNVGGRFFADRTAKYFPRTPPGTMGVKVFDWNRDGRLDLLLTDMHADMIENVGPEREKEKDRPPAGTPPEVLAHSIFGNALFEGTADGGFKEVSDQVGAENYWPWGVSVADFNADGWDDVFIASSMNYPFRYAIDSLLLNDRGRRFLDAEFVLGIEPRAEPTQPWFELDCPSGKGDEAKGGAQTTDPMAAWKVFSHPGESTGGAGGGVHPQCVGHSGRVVVMAAKGSRSSVVFDLDGDGDLDLVTNEFNGAPQVLISDLAQRRPVHYLEVALQGTRSNRDGLGAKVTLVTDQGSHLMVNDGKSGYLSQSRMPLYFGLADGETPLRLEVVWPSGAHQTVERPEPNRLATVVEPAAAAPAPASAPSASGR